MLLLAASRHRLMVMRLLLAASRNCRCILMLMAVMRVVMGQIVT